MKKLNSAICSIALLTTMGVGITLFAELDDTIDSGTTVTIGAVDLDGTATFADDFTVLPNAATLTGIWDTATFNVQNNSGAPIFYIYSSLVQTGVTLTDYGVGTPPDYDDQNALDAASVNFVIGEFAGRSDEQWTNMGITATNTDFWVGVGDSETGTYIFNLYTDETDAPHLASRFSDLALTQNSDIFNIRTGTSWASSVTIGIASTVTFELLVAEFGAEPIEYSFIVGGETLGETVTTLSLTEESLPEMAVEGSPAYYGLYEDAAYTEKITLPYSGSTETLYAKFTEKPTNLNIYEIFSGDEYAVAGLGAGFVGGVLEIPESYNGKPITTITDSAFSGYGHITSIIIPDSIIDIGADAFKGTDWYENQANGVVYAGKVAYAYKGTMPADTTIVLNSDTSGVADWAFINQTTLTGITIPSGVVRIGDSVFSGCTGLSSITVPDSVISIGSGAFTNSAWYNSQSNNAVLYAGKVALEYKLAAYTEMPANTTLVLNNDTLGIAASAFSDKATLIGITIPEGVKTIGNNAFLNCSGITSVTIPSTITNVGQSAFENCTSLASTTLTSGVTGLNFSVFKACSALESITIPASLGLVPESAFYNCTGLTDVTIASGITQIGGSAFGGCTSLTSISIPSGVTKIGSWAFANCTLLASITIPNTVYEMGSGSFESTAWYTNQSNGMVYAGKVAYAYKGTMTENTSIVFNGDTTGIAGSAFANWTGDYNLLTDITMPSTLRFIGETPFYNDIGLTSFTVNASNEYFSSSNGILFNKNSTQLVAYPVGKADVTYSVPATVTSIGSYAFSYSPNLTGVTLPDGLLKIGESAFSYTSLTGITIPNSVTTLGGSAFSFSTVISEIVIPSNITSIGYRAFEGCTGLTSVTLNEGLVSIEEAAFNTCTGISEIILPTTLVYIAESGTFYDCTSLGTVTVNSEYLAYVMIDEMFDIRQGNIYDYANTIYFENTITPSGTYFDPIEGVYGYFEPNGTEGDFNVWIRVTDGRSLWGGGGGE